MAEHKKGNEERMQPGRRDQETTRREGEREQGGRTQDNPNNPQRRQGS